MSHTDVHDGSDRPTADGGARLLSLDAFRGAAIFVMLLVNNFGPSERTPVQLRHAAFEGVHIADLAFPWFLLCVGVAIPFSSASFERKGLPWWRYDLRVIRRTVILLALGAMLESFGYRHLDLFTVGVLQMIAISYLVGALLYEVSLPRRMAVAFAMLVAYWAAIKFIPIPGVGAGVFRPDQNLILHLNREYLGYVSLWNLPQVVSTTALVLIGTGVGDMLIRKDMDSRQKARLLVWIGVALVAVGLIWSQSLLINKRFWTPSYTLVSAGTGCLVLSAFSYLVDINVRHAWAFPFVVFGSNAILAYVGPILFKSLVLFPLDVSIHGWFRVLAFTMLWWLVLLALYRRKLFLRV